MPADWKKLVEESGDKTKKEFRNEISSLTALTDSQVTALINETGISNENFAKVLEVVNSATLSNEKKAKAIQSIENGVTLLVGIVKKLII